MNTRTDTEILEWVAIWVVDIASAEHDEDGEIIIIKFYDDLGFTHRNHGVGKDHLEALRNAVLPCMGETPQVALCPEPVLN